MITIKTKAEIEKMRLSGRIVEGALELLGRNIRPGITTEALNKLAHDYIVGQGATPSFLGYNGYPKSVCISINEEVVHGIPSNRRLRKGDIVSCDIGAELDGWQGDAARTFIVGEADEEVERLVRVTRECFFEGLKFCKEGYRISDISAAIQSHAEKHGYGVVRDLVGHGIGRQLHEEPEVPNFVSPWARQRLQAGMTLAIEPMINLGTWKVWQMDDGWTVKTRDGKPSAHYENTLAITEGEPVLLTCSEELA
ncbi:MAG: type I methionyl aminopeptidase [Clostridia bacterium]|nr:type I methionyl aminopeptidase [Clostridia bacterium]